MIESDTVTRSTEDIVQSAAGGFKSEYITQTNSVSTPIIEHISDGEQLQYLFFHGDKGYRLFEPNGEEQTPHHDITSWGKQFLVITDKRLLYIVGKKDGDQVEVFDYDDITGIDYNEGWTHGRINWTMSEGSEYKFADTGYLSDDIEDAGSYLNKQIQTTETKKKSPDENTSNLKESENPSDAIEDISGINSTKADVLREAGYGSIEDIVAASQEDLAEIEDIGNALAARIKADIGGLQVTPDQSDVSIEDSKSSTSVGDDTTPKTIMDISGIDDMTAEALRRADHDSIEDIMMLSIVELAELAGVDDARAARIKSDTVDLDYNEDDNPITTTKGVLSGVKFEDAMDRAETALSNDDLEQAQHKYEDIISHLERAQEKFTMLSDDHRQSLAQRLKAAQTAHDEVVNRRTQERLKQAGAEAFEEGNIAKENGEFETAEKQYKTAFEQLKQASESYAGSPSSQQENTERIDTVREHIDTVRHLKEQRKNISEMLQAAERSFQEGIAGYADGDHTLSRIRFRQARDEFNEVHETGDNLSDTVLKQPIGITVEPQQSLPSDTLETFSQLSDETLEVLSTTDIESVADLTVENNSMAPTTVSTFEERGVVTDEEAVLLTILSWWHGRDSIEITTVDEINQRSERAEYGFNIISQ